MSGTAWAAMAAIAVVIAAGCFLQRPAADPSRCSDCGAPLSDDDAVGLCRDCWGGRQI